MVGAGKGRNGKECLTRGEEEEKERFGNWIAPNEADLSVVLFVVGILVLS